jgi:hypothetical protein
VGAGYNLAAHGAAPHGALKKLAMLRVARGHALRLDFSAISASLPHTNTKAIPCGRNYSGCFKWSGGESGVGSGGASAG